MRCGLAVLAVAVLALGVGGCRLVKNPTETATSDYAGGTQSAATTNSGSKLEIMAQAIWTPKLRPYFAEKATDLSVLVPAMKLGIDVAGKQYGFRPGGEGTPWSFAIRFKGRIVAANTETRAATAAIDLDGDGKPDATLQLGPVIRGTSLRDALPFVNFSDFTDQIEFASFSRALNDRAYKTVLEPLPRQGLPGREVSGQGAFTMRGSTDEILITPVALQLGGGA
jgi:predicted lipoprotein